MTPESRTQIVLDYERPQRPRRSRFRRINLVGKILLAVPVAMVGCAILLAYFPAVIEGDPWATAVLAALVILCVAKCARPLHRRLQKRKWDRRERAGLCVICGYDLRGTPQKCPECGVDSVKLYGERLHRELWPNDPTGESSDKPQGVQNDKAETDRGDASSLADSAGAV